MPLTNITPDRIFLAALIFITLAGGMVMPALVVLARVARRLVVIGIGVGIAEARSELAKWLLIALLALFGMGFAHAAAAEPVRTAAITTVPANDSTVDEIIERTMRAIKSSKKPLPAWAVEMALRAYDAYKTFRNGQKVEEVRREVLAVLKVVAEIKEQVESGREMTDREFRLTRELLDAHSRRLGDLTVRIGILEPRVDDLEAAIAAQIAKAKAWARYNRVCKEAAHVWRPRLGKCLHISVAGPRR